MSADPNNRASVPWRSALWLWVVGLILLSAALLKGYELVTDPFAGDPFFGNRPAGLLLTFLELGLALWLFSVWRPLWAKRISICCFTLFLALSLSQAGRGVSTCGCFGRVEISPWVTVGVDVCVLGILILTHAPPSRTDLISAAAVLFVSAGIAGTAAMIRTGNTPHLSVIPHSLDLGTIEGQQSIASNFTLVNLGSSDVIVGEVKSSCECLTVELARTRIAPSEKRIGSVFFDPNRKPAFTGPLRIHVQGEDSDGRPLFRLIVLLKVR